MEGLAKQPRTSMMWMLGTCPHNQLVMKTIRSAASVAVYSSHDGFLRASTKSRELMPRFESKKDYQKNFL